MELNVEIEAGFVLKGIQGQKSCRTTQNDVARQEVCCKIAAFFELYAAFIPSFCYFLR